MVSTDNRDPRNTTASAAWPPEQAGRPVSDKTIRHLLAREAAARVLR